MIITGFSRIDTVTVPDRFMSVIRISDSGIEADIQDIKAKLEEDKESLDYLCVTADTDPLEYPDLYKAIKQVRPKGLKVLICTDCRDPSVLDDLIGAGYANAANIIIGNEITDQQMSCIDLIRDNGCKYSVTLNAIEHDRDSVLRIAMKLEGCSMFILRQDRAKPLDRNRMSELSGAARTCTWNVRMNRSPDEILQFR